MAGHLAGQLEPKHWCVHRAGGGTDGAVGEEEGEQVPEGDAGPVPEEEVCDDTWYMVSKSGSASVWKSSTLPQDGRCGFEALAV